jgi:hypothetical protein
MYKQDEFKNIITNLYHYSTVYIAIGAKYYNITDYPLLENTGKSQLIPEFIINNSYQIKTLIIIIDTFNKEEFKENNTIIKNIIENTETNIDYFIINDLFNETIKNEIVNLINNLTIQNIYIVDYVFFFNIPNLIEQQTLKIIKTFINELLEIMIHKYNTEDLPKNKNIYKWLGKIDSNYILNYRKYKIFSNQINQSRIIIENQIKNNIQLNVNQIINLKHIESIIDKFCLKITPDY